MTDKRRELGPEDFIAINLLIVFVAFMSSMFF